ncbi:MAG: lysozyme inhibitor LprI family protein [Bacteroidia bacterium]
MKKFLIKIFILFLFTSKLFAQSQSEMNHTAKINYQKDDSTLNVVYTKILKEYSADTTFIKNLIASQKIWIKFRDAELKMKYPANHSYGSVQPMCVSNYLSQLTTDRIKTLQVWLDGIEEGDVCAGSVKRKN